MTLSSSDSPALSAGTVGGRMPFISNLRLGSRTAPGGRIGPVPSPRGDPSSARSVARNTTVPRASRARANAAAARDFHGRAISVGVTEVLLHRGAYAASRREAGSQEIPHAISTALLS